MEYSNSLILKVGDEIKDTYGYHYIITSVSHDLITAERLPVLEGQRIDTTIPTGFMYKWHFAERGKPRLKHRKDIA